jgi:hypothetical protein
MTTETAREEGFDPTEAFIAEDGYEYENFAAFLIRRKADCWRNHNVEASRASGVPEEKIRAWIEAFDGKDPTPSVKLDQEARSKRQVRANAAVSARGLGLGFFAPKDDYWRELYNVVARQSRQARAA